MVKDNLAYQIAATPKDEIVIDEIPVKWCAVSLSEIIERGMRLEASVYDVEAKQAYMRIKNGLYPAVDLIGPNSPVKKAHYGGRLKRNYVEKNEETTVGFIGSSEMLDVSPQPVKFMIDDDRVSELHVKRGTVLISRSGTIGNMSFVNETLEKFSAFMKAWIAFNAWYNFSGEVTGKNDKECIEYIASQPNRFKTYTMNLINAEDADGSAYRENIAKLHGSLLNAAIVTQEYIGVRQSVSFAEVAVKNANTLKQKDYYQHHYECSRAHGKMKTVVTIKATGDSVFCFEQDGYDIDVLRQQSGFIGLTQRQKEQCEECYRELTPYHITSVLASGEATKQMGAYNFINDAGKISEAIVIILYMLRCCLAHGDISPDESANEVYKYAYEVLCAPLRKLK